MSTSGDITPKMFNNEIRNLFQIKTNVGKTQIWNERHKDVCWLQIMCSLEIIFRVPIQHTKTM